MEGNPMSKRRTKPGDILHPENYFNRYVALEIRKEKEKNQKYYDSTCSLEKKLAGEAWGAKAKNQLLLAVNLDSEEFEKYIVESDDFGWIEMIENEALYAAVTQLSERDKIILTLRYQYCLSQLETAKIMGFAQSTESWRESQIIKKIKKFLEMFDRNR